MTANGNGTHVHILAMLDSVQRQLDDIRHLVIAWQRDIEALKAMPYAEYLQTEHWQETRKRALDRAGSRCQMCNGASKLQVHHRTYDRRGEELDADLIVLCEGCHEHFHSGRQTHSDSMADDQAFLDYLKNKYAVDGGS